MRVRARFAVPFSRRAFAARAARTGCAALLTAALIASIAPPAAAQPTAGLEGTSTSDRAAQASKAAAAPQAEPDSGPPATRRAGEEIPERRDRYSRTYKGEQPGRLRRQVFTKPAHYQESGVGAWKEIDSRLAAGSAPGRFRNRANDFALDGWCEAAFWKGDVPREAAVGAGQDRVTSGW